MRNKDILALLEDLLEIDIPYQFVSLIGLSFIEKLCRKLNLPEPKLFAGNIIIGDLNKCDFLLTAHLDELSFGFITIDEKGGILAPYHKHILSDKEFKLKIIGVRNNKITTIGRGLLILKDNQPYCKSQARLKRGDRVVYDYPVEIKDDLVTGKAIDDRVGVLISLLAGKELLNKGCSIAIVLSDGEEQIPEGYFSRNFPHVLPILKKECRICFIDGIFRDGLESIGYTGPPKTALIVSHSSYGKGYVVSPFTYAWLRDEIIPKAKKQGIGAELCDAYRSRGDEWGMVMNPIMGKEYDCFFVDFGAWGDVGHEIPLAVDVAAIQNCVGFIALAAQDKICSQMLKYQRLSLHNRS